jgi:hypothetical protein
MKTMKSIFALLCFVLLLNVSSRSQIQFLRRISPISNQPSAEFSSIAVSQFGDIYLLEKKRAEIYRLNEDGTILNVNGGFGWGEGQFDTPMDISMASGLDLIVADYNNHRIVRFDRNLNYITTYPNLNSDFQIFFPRSVILSNLGEIFILDDENSEIARLNAQQGDVTVFAGIEYGNYALTDSRLIRLSPAGLVTVLENHNRILQFDRFGSPLSIFKIPSKSAPIGLILIDEDFLILLEEEPFLMIYSKNLEKWMTPVVVGLEKELLFIAGTYTGQQLYLLEQSGDIIVCSVVIK